MPSTAEKYVAMIAAQRVIERKKKEGDKEFLRWLRRDWNGDPEVLAQRATGYLNTLYSYTAEEVLVYMTRMLKGFE